MRSFFNVGLLVGLCFAILLSSCAPRLAAAPLIVDPPSTPIPTLTSTPPATATVEIPAPVEPTFTPTSAACQINRVKAIPVFDQNGLLKSFDTPDKFIVLTIDDGYNNEVLNQMLDILEEHGARATFFLVGTSFGKNIRRDTFQRLVDNGHDIGYHSLTHPDVNIIDGMSQEEWLQDYQDWSDALRAVIGDDLYSRGVTPYIRAPWGRWTAEFMQAAHKQGFTPVYWSADEHTFEPNRMPLKPGGILILHIIPENLDELQQLMKTDWQIISLREALSETCN